MPAHWKTKVKVCQRCGCEYETKANNAKYCLECRFAIANEKAKDRARRIREGTYVPREKTGRPRLYPEQPPKKQGTQNRPPDYKPTICWGCANAVPRNIGEKHYGCEWSESLDPVPGWKVITHDAPKTVAGDRFRKGISVQRCPKFIPDAEAEMLGVVVDVFRTAN